MRRRGIKAERWFDAHDVLKDVSATSRSWKDYENDKPPYDKLGYPTRFKIESRDTPVMPFRQARTLKFAIKTTSAEKCPCTLNELVVFATQTLIPAGEDAIGNRIEGTWDLRMGLGTSLPNCGPVPFKNPPKGLNDLDLLS